MQLSYNSKFKPQKYNHLYVLVRKNVKLLSISVTCFFVFVLILINLTSNSKSGLSFNFNKSHSQFIKYHGFTKNQILTKSPLIFPSIEHAPFLREMTVDSLFNYQLDPQGRKTYQLTESVKDEELKANQLTEETNQMIRIKNSFLNHGKLKFAGSKSPEIVLVTGVDFELNELSHLTKVVQNRVNYCQNQKYGLYVRWIQEFLPLLQVGDKNDYKKLAKLYLLRSAMYAFPNAKYFWYLDENSLIMNYDIDLNRYLLNLDVLDPILLKDQPLIPPNGIIRTFKNQKPTDVDIIITQLDQDLNTDSFILKNSFTSKSLLEFWTDNLFRKYHNFPKTIESSLLHILQWHPIFLAKTGIVPTRTIASFYSALDSAEQDLIHYSDGDFVVNLRDCEKRGSCAKEIELHWNKLEGK